VQSVVSPSFLAAILLAAVPSISAQTPVKPTPDSTLAGLAPLVGAWRPASDDPQYAGRIVHDHRWTVGGKALRVREGYAVGKIDDAEVDGIVLWNPATERIEFVAVGGHGPGQGRYFTGEYRVLADGAFERIYDVFYRSLADTPGEELGGGRRRYREVYRLAGADTLNATLDWWREGNWEPFGPGRYSLIRVRTP
jgi:hypothetical protein